MKKILVVNNNDSFVYNLVELLRGKCSFDVVLTQNLYKGIESNYNMLLLSPGAGLPNNYPQMMQLIKRCSNTHSIFGVCLGCQAIAEAFGATLMQLPQPKHGHCSTLQILEGSELLFKNVPLKSNIGRYHSWVINPSSIPDSLKIIATDEENNIMAIRHATLPIYGVQFHPESIISDYGKIILENWDCFIM
ncbi:MAG: aminodeoxychorismate/anthranilate synthase component II [Bacteroidales bacterium]